jgi:phosphoglycerol transferase MdoB-like AlkP superfamily enzyme
MDPLLDLPVEEPVSQTTEEIAAPIESVTTVHEVAATSKPSVEVERQYPSLYDSYGTTFAAILLAVVIISSVIGIVTYIYRRAKSDHAALTQFVTTMFALIAGVYVADKVIAGPSTELLSEQEAVKVLEFIQQTCLMVFAYYFGTKAQPPKDEINNE